MSTDRIQELEAKVAELDARATKLEQGLKVKLDQIASHKVGSSSNRRLAKRYTRAARRITGRSVKVLIRDPSTRGSSGLFTRTKNMGHITLSPKLDAEAIIHTFLHEVGHCLLHWNSIRPSKCHLDLPRTEDGPGKSPNKPARYDIEEDEADNLADTLVSILNTHLDILDPNYEKQALSILTAWPQHKTKS